MPEPKDDFERRRRQRNLAIALLVGAFIVTVYLVTILRIGGNIAASGF